jgi:large subunit ribosomal protein L23
MARLKSSTTGELRLKPHQVVLRPLVTEKGMHRSTRHNAYAFEVNVLATKGDIRNAVEERLEKGHRATSSRASHRLLLNQFRTNNNSQA